MPAITIPHTRCMKASRDFDQLSTALRLLTAASQPFKTIMI